jgi:hypothetical protein
MQETTIEASALQFLTHGKEKLKTLCKERTMHQWEKNKQVQEEDQSRKHEGLAPAQLITELKQPMVLIANLLSVLTAWLN